MTHTMMVQLYRAGCSNEEHVTLPAETIRALLSELDQLASSRKSLLAEVKHWKHAAELAEILLMGGAR